MLKRPINNNELLLVKHLWELKENKNIDIEIPSTVTELNDGGMGTIRFETDESAKYAKDIIQVEYKDADEVPVFITLTSDEQGRLFELDFWKADFNKLIKYPTPNTLLKNNPLGKPPDSHII